MNNHAELLITFLSKAIRDGHTVVLDIAKITGKTAGRLYYDKKIEITFSVYPGQSPGGPELAALIENARESSIEY